MKRRLLPLLALVLVLAAGAALLAWPRAEFIAATSASSSTWL